MARKDRERAISTGMIFRDGHLVNAKQWHADHPTKTEAQAKVDSAVTAELAKKFDAIPEAVAETADVPKVE